jgi:hypothetical protein
MPARCRVDAHGPAAIVDVEARRDGCAGNVERGDSALGVPHEAVRAALAVDVLAGDVAVVADAEGPGLHRAPDPDARDAAAVEKEAVLEELSGPLGLPGVRAHHLAAGVDLRDEGSRRAGDVDRPEAVAAANEAVEGPAPVSVRAHDPVATLAAEGDRQRCARDVEGREAACVADEAVAADAAADAGATAIATAAKVKTRRMLDPCPL